MSIRVKSASKFLMLALPIAISVANMGLVQSAVAEDLAIEEVTVLGSRTADRSSADLPVPVDVISGSEFNSIGGGADITDNLNALVPSYLAAPATGDGSAFVRPTSLRGMASDQTLVLVNGKRRHRSSLVQLFAPAANNGSHGVDIAMIPSLALKQVEVLRDGAASQYGSDAIAGVINFNLNDSAEGGAVELNYGQHYEGESSWKFAANGGFDLNGIGFANLTFETNDNEGLSRGIQRADGQALVDAGASGVGSDAQFGGAAFVQTWGRPKTSATRFVFNTGITLSDAAELYLFGNYAKSDGTYRFFYRDNGNDDLLESVAAGATNLSHAESVGYTPYLDGAQTDMSAVFGLRGDIGETHYDVSIGTGSNELDYSLYNTLNGDAPLINGTNAQRDFDVGGYEQEEITVTVDFSTPLSDSLNLAYGAEYRDEKFTQNGGESASYVGGGSSGLGGIAPESSGSNSRDNYAFYGDLEQEVTDSFFMQYAVRYEDFSDFGDTINYKLASRYNVTDDFTVRGSVSTGFHAPTPGQANLRSSPTTFDNMNNIIVVGLLPADDPEVAALGGKPLKEEEALNFSAGFAYQLGEQTSVTVDGYLVEVSDRIYRTSVGDVSFYTNALDVEHQGVDLVLTSGHAWSDDIDTNFILSYGYGDIKVTGNKLINGNQVVSDDTVEDIENNYPEHKWTATANTAFSDKVNLMLRARYIGEHYDERGNISGTSDNGKSAKIDGIAYVDIELRYDINTELSFAVGGSNIFDTYPTEIRDEPGQANRIGVGLQYPRRSVANYEGGSMYMKMTYNF